MSGHDLGRGVERVFGYGEFEWSVTIDAEALPRLAQLLATTVDGLLDALLECFSGREAFKFRSFLEQHGLVDDRFTRISD